MFLLANDKDLGNLSHLQIWHDNSGEGSYGSWYLNQVMVYDVRWRKTYDRFENSYYLIIII